MAHQKFDIFDIVNVIKLKLLSEKYFLPQKRDTLMIIILASSISSSPA